MTTKPDVAAFSTFRIKTATETVTFHRSRTSAYSEASVNDAAARVASVGCSFELYKPAVIIWADGHSWTGGQVISVVQVPDTEIEATP